MGSVTLTKFNERKITHFTYRKAFIAGLNFLVLTMLYAYINSFVFSKGFASQMLLFLGEKALLFFQESPYQIENLIFVYPPIPYLFFLFLRNPFLSSAVVGGIAVSTFMWYLWKHICFEKKMHVAFYIFIIYMCVSPLAIYLFAENIASCFLVFLILLCLHFFYYYYKNKLTINLFLFGIITATIFFVHFEVSFILGFWALSIFIIRYNKLSENIIPILVVTIFPLIFFALGWLYLNWLHTNDFFHFIQPWNVAISSQKFDPKLLNSNPHFSDFFFSRAKFLLHNFYFIFPSVFLALVITVVKKFRNFIHFQILIFPFFLIFADFFWGGLLAKSGSHFFLLFVATGNFVFIHHPRLTSNLIVKKIYVISILLSFSLSLWAPFYTGTLEEKQFLQALYGYANFSNLDDEKKLFEKIKDSGKILVDDSVLYSLVFLSNEPQRFILPHESEFKLALEKPELFVKYIVVSNYGQNDILLSHYGPNYIHNIKNFDLIEQYDNLSLYKKSDSRLANRVLKH